MMPEFYLFAGVILVVLILILWKVFSTQKPSSNTDSLVQLQNAIQEKNLEIVKYQEKNQALERTIQAQKDDYSLQIDGLESKLAEIREKWLDAEKSKASLETYLESQEQILLQQKEEMNMIRQQFQSEFKVLANQIFEEKSQKFVEHNRSNLDQILQPLQEKIKTFEKKVEDSYSTEAAQRNALKGMVEKLYEQSISIQSEANNLTRALKGDNKKQGNWGEVILERVLETSGLRKDEEYRLQVNLKNDEGGRQIPDAIIMLPEGKHLIIDSKVSLNAYQGWINADDDALKEKFAKEHVVSVLNHVKNLSSKNYAQLYDMASPDFVLLFMPIESAFSLALNQRPEIFSESWERKVVMVSPTTLLATLRTVASVWKQERQNRYALDIAHEAGALYDKFEGFIKDMEKVSTQLDSAQKSHHEAFKKLSLGNGNVMRRIENLKDLGAKANKQIDSKYLD